MLFAVGVGGFFALSLVTAIVVPLLALAFKIAFIVLIGYLILRLIKPDKAEEMRNRFKSS
jgi:phage shock protein PspC (stress-responsive transcriptional regulator)